MTGVLFRLRQWLMWKIAPAPVKRRTWAIILAVQHSAGEIREETSHSEIENGAESIEQRTEDAIELLQLDDDSITSR